MQPNKSGSCFDKGVLESNLSTVWLTTNRGNFIKIVFWRGERGLEMKKD